MCARNLRQCHHLAAFLEPLPGFSFKIEVAPVAGLGFSALGFFGSRLLLFWPVGIKRICRPG